MICSKCGFQNEEQALFCGKCGHNLRVPASAGDLVRERLEPAGSTSAPTVTPAAHVVNTGVANKPEVSSYLPLTIFTIMCCCQPLGIVALLHSVKVNQHLEKGEYDQAVDASKKTKMFCLIGIIGGFTIISLYLLLAVGTELMKNL